MLKRRRRKLKTVADEDDDASCGDSLFDLTAIHVLGPEVILHVIPLDEGDNGDAVSSSFASRLPPPSSSSHVTPFTNAWLLPLLKENMSKCLLHHSPPPITTLPLSSSAISTSSPSLSHFSSSSSSSSSSLSSSAPVCSSSPSLRFFHHSVYLRIVRLQQQTAVARKEGRLMVARTLEGILLQVCL